MIEQDQRALEDERRKLHTFLKKKRHSLQKMKDGDSKKVEIETECQRILERLKQIKSWLKNADSGDSDSSSLSAMPQSTRSEQNFKPDQTGENNFSTYQKLEGTSNDGKDYEYLTCALYAAKLSTSDNIIDFEMTTNDKKCGLFDDISIKVTFKNQTSQKYLFQLKHKKNSKTITLEHLRNKTGDFSLKKYTQSVLDLKTNDNDITCILYTNAKTNISHGDKLEYEPGKFITAEKFFIDHKELFLNSNIKREEPFRFESERTSFYFFTNQMNVSCTKKLLEDVLFQVVQTNIGTRFSDFMKEWWSGNFVLTKHDVLAKITELALSPYTRTISSSKCNKKTKFLEESIMTSEITIAKTCDKNIVQNIWTSASNITDAFNTIIRKYGLTLDDKKQSKVLWYSGSAPLIVDVNESNLISVKSVLNFMKKDIRDRKIVLLGDIKRGDLENWKVFENLNDVIQNTSLLSEYKLSLQGKAQISLHDFLKIDPSLTEQIKTQDLFEMSQSDDFVVAKTGTEWNHNLYIPRKVSTITKKNIFKIIDKPCRIIINCDKNFKAELVQEKLSIIEVSEYLTQSEKQNYGRFILVATDNKCSLDEFQKVCDKDPHISVYLIQVVNNDVILLLSKENTNIVESIKLDKTIKEDQIFDYFDHHLHVICAPPGMGKSFLLQSLSSSYCPPHCWAVHVNLINHNSFLRNVDKQNSAKSVLEYFLKESCATEEPNVQEIQTILLQNQKVYFFLDGLDEVDGGVVDIVLEFVKYVTSSGNHVWITSRPNLREKIIHELNVVPIDMVKFDKKEQHLYISKGLNELYREPEITEIIDAIFNSTDIVNSQEILSIPLQLYMITEIFRNKVENFDKGNIFVLTKLYKLFFVGKITFSLKKIGVTNTQDIDDLFDFGYILKRYELLALRATLDDTDFEKLNIDLNDCNTFTEKVKKQGDQLGIIQTINKNNKAVFQHQTYAEYFTCLWLKSHKNKVKLLEGELFSERYQNLKRMFDIMLAEESPLHLAVIYENVEQFQENIKDVNVKDEGGRNALHLACSYGKKYPKSEEFSWEKWTPESVSYRQIINTLLTQNIKFSGKDGLFRFDCLDYALMAGSLYLVETFLGSGKVEWEVVRRKLSKKIPFKEIVEYGLFLGLPNLINLSIQVQPKIAETIMKTREFLSEAMADRYNMTAKPSKKITPAEPMSKFEENTTLNSRCYNLEEPNQIGSFLTSPFNILLRNDLSKETLAKLLEEPTIEINISDESGNIPLHSACKQGDVKQLREILADGGDIHIRDSDNNTLLHSAVATSVENREVIELLLNYGLNLGAENKKGQTPLHIASASSNLDNLNLLIKNSNTEIHKKDKNGNSSLHYAAAANKANNEIIALLTKRGIDVNSRNKFQETPLHISCIKGVKENVKILLHAGADTNALGLLGQSLLHYAASRNEENIQIIELLIKQGQDINARNKLGLTPLSLVCYMGVVQNLQKLLTNTNANISTVDFDGQSLLHWAVITKNNTEIINLLLQYGLNIDVRDKNDNPPIAVASRRGEAQNVEMLLENGADINILDKQGNSLLHNATRFVDNNSVIDVLIKRGLNPNIRNNFGQTPLSIACMFGKVKNVKKLLELKADINTRDQFNNSILHAAVSMMDKNTEIIKLLVIGGINVDDRNKSGCTPLHSACLSGNTENVKDLINAKANVNVKTAKGESLLHDASFGVDSNLEIIDLLINAGIDINVQDETGLTPLFDACLRGNVKNFKKLLAANADMDIKDNNDDTLLHFAVSMVDGNVEIIDYLFNAGMDVNAKDKTGSTPIFYACQNGKTENFKKLLDANANIDIKNDYDDTLLHVAVSIVDENFEIIDLLVNGGLDVNVKNKTGSTPIFYACLNGKTENLKKLLNASAEIDTKNDNGDTLLHVAVSELDENFEIIDLLVSGGMDVNVKNKTGSTPIFYACQNGKTENFKKLLDANANIDVRNDYDDTLLHVAVPKVDKNFKIIDLLVNAGVDVNAKNKMGLTPIFYACQSGKTENFKKLLNTSAKIDIKNDNDETLLHVAVSEVDENFEIINLLVNGGMDVNVKNNTGSTPIFYACLNGKTENFKKLLDANANIDIRNDYDDTLLHVAVSEVDENFEIIDLLVNAGVDVNAKNKMGLTPIFYACQSGKTENFKKLLNTSAKIDIKNYNDDTLLHVAVSEVDKNFEIINLLVNGGIDVNVKNNTGSTPIFYACLNGKTENFRKLLDANANIDIRNDHDNTLLHVAVSEVDENFEIIDLLVNAGAGVDVNAKNKMGSTPIFYACQSGKTENFKKLLNTSAKIDIKNDNDETLLHVAVSEVDENFEIINLLVNGGMDVNVKNNTGSTPIFYACLNGKTENFKKLLDANANIDIRNDHDDTLLHVAVSEVDENFEIIDLLVNAGAGVDVNAKNKMGSTPIFYACQSGKIENFKKLLNTSAKIDIKNDNDETLLHVAVSEVDENFEIINLLVNGGMDVNVKNNTGSTPIFYACLNGKTENFKKLLDANANIDIRNDHDDTLLHVAVSEVDENFEIIDLLVNAGVDVNAKNKMGSTPIFYACLNGKTKNLKKLLDANANIYIKDNNDNSLLHIASCCIDNNLEVIELLVERDLDLNTRNVLGKTPLDLACMNGMIKNAEKLLDIKDTKDQDNQNLLHSAVEGIDANTEMIKLLINLGFDVDFKNIDGHTPSCFACLFGKTNDLKTLLDAKANVMIKDSMGNTLLHKAACGVDGNTEIIDVLIDSGIEIDAKNSEGRTALHVACHRGNIKNLKKLLNANADVNIKDNNDCSILHYAVSTQNDNTEVIDLLLQYNLDLNAPNKNGLTPLQTAHNSGNSKNIQKLLEASGHSRSTI